jgi:hypothetical protein
MNCVMLPNYSSELLIREVMHAVNILLYPLWIVCYLAIVRSLETCKLHQALWMWGERVPANLPKNVAMK